MRLEIRRDVSLNAAGDPVQQSYVYLDGEKMSGPFDEADVVRISHALELIAMRSTVPVKFTMEHGVRERPAVFEG